MNLCSARTLLSPVVARVLIEEHEWVTTLEAERESWCPVTVLGWRPTLAPETGRCCLTDDLTIRECLQNRICFLVLMTEHQGSGTCAVRRLHRYADLLHDRWRAHEAEPEQEQEQELALVAGQEVLVLDLEVVAWVAVRDVDPMERPRGAPGVC